MPIDIVGPSLGGVLPWILIAGVLSILGAAFRALLLPKIKGRLGESVVNARVRRDLDPNVYHLIPDVMLPTADGTTQIDHVIVSRYGVFVVETKTYKGWIFGGEHEAQWTQVNFRRKDRFQNPLRQNYKHTKTLADLTGLPHEYFKSVVVFAGDCTFKTEMPANVVYARDSTGYIKAFQAPILTDNQVSEIVRVIQQSADGVTGKQRAGHVANVRLNKRAESADRESPVCPRCRAAMAQRTNRKDGSRFWGCTQYPACRGTREAA